MNTSPLAGRTLGILLSTDPGTGDLETCLGLASAALDLGVEVYLYLIDDGVVVVDDERVQALALRGVRLFACAYGRRRRRLPITDSAIHCGLAVLTDVINGTERLVALT